MVLTRFNYYKQLRVYLLLLQSKSMSLYWVWIQV